MGTSGGAAARTCSGALVYRLSPAHAALTKSSSQSAKVRCSEQSAHGGWQWLKYCSWRGLTSRRPTPGRWHLLRPKCHASASWTQLSLFKSLSTVPQWSWRSLQWQAARRGRRYELINNSRACVCVCVYYCIIWLSLVHGHPAVSHNRHRTLILVSNCAETSSSRKKPYEYLFCLLLPWYKLFENHQKFKK